MAAELHVNTMSRLGSILSTLTLTLTALTLTACAGDVVDPAAPFPSEPEDPPPSSPPPPTDAEPPAECLAVPTGMAVLGTADHEELRDVVILPTGSILAVGYERATWTPHGLFGGRGIALELSSDLLAMSRAGAFDTTGTDSLESIGIAPNTGEVYAVGRTNGELAGMPSLGGFDFVVGEITTTGGFEPRARGFESTSEYAHRIAVGTSGLLAIAGHEVRPTSDGSTSIDPFLAVYDVNDGSASPLWFTSRRHAADETYRAVDVSATAVVVGGDIADGDQQGMYVTAWDRDAGRLWRRELSQRGGDTITAVRVLPSGDVLWAGSSTIDDLDIVVGVLDGATGEPRWTRAYGRPGADRVADLAVDANGRIAVVGDADADAFLLVLDPAGSVLLDERWSSDGDDRPTAVAMDACGGIAIVGYTTGDLVDVHAGGRDAFVLVTHLASEGK